MKKLFIIAVLVVAGTGIYYASFYFRSTTVDEAMPSAEQNLREGNFTAIDAIHKGSGKAVLLRSGGEQVLRLENFEVTNGPDLYVYLIKNPRPTHSDESLGEFIDLGRLKANKGNQNYALGADIKNPEDFTTVVIWCKQFGVLFSYANLN